MKPPADIMEGKASAASPSRLQNRVARYIIATGKPFRRMGKFIDDAIKVAIGFTIPSQDHQNSLFKGPGKSSLTLQELQELAEKQKQQIYLNNKELLAKQQKLLELQQHGFRNKVRYSPSVSSPQEQDSYAAKLRETYQNHLERLREMQIVQDDSDTQRFSNIELSFELDRVRDMFLSKQRELASAVAKVESLTKQLEERKSGVTTWNITPEKMRRRRKIQAAREELDKLRNEMTIRNELNNQQSHQLKVQKEILREKQKELNDLDAQIHVLGKQLRQYQTKGQADNLNYKPSNGDNAYRGNFTPANLYDSLQRKRIASKSLTALNLPGYHQLSFTPTHSPSLPDVNGNVYQQGSTSRNGLTSRQSVSTDSLGRRKLENGAIKRGSPVPCTRRGNLYVAPDGREFDRPPTWEDFLAMDKQVEPNRMFSPTLSTQSETSTSSGGSIQPPPSPNLPQGRTDVKPALQVNGLDSAHSSVNNSPKTQGPAFRDSPLSGLSARKDLFASRLNDSLKPAVNGNSISPSSSVSSLSSMSSSMTNDEIRPILSSSKDSRDSIAPYASYLTKPDRSSLTSPQGYMPVTKQGQDVWNDSTEFRALESSSPIPPPPAVSSPIPPSTAVLPRSASLSTPSSVVFKDAPLSDCVDVINSKVLRFVDSNKSSAREIINYSYLHRAVSSPSNFEPSDGVDKMTGEQVDGYMYKNDAQSTNTPISVTTGVSSGKAKPPVAPKPSRQPPAPPAPKASLSATSVDGGGNASDENLSVKNLVEKFAGEANRTSSPVPTELLNGAARNEDENDSKVLVDSIPPPPLDETDNAGVNSFSKEFPPPPPYIPKIPDHDPPPYSEIENYEISSFADIDMISATQNDLLPFLINASRSQYMNDSQDSMYDSDSSSQKSDEKVIIPVVISVPPEKMPPPILMKPGKERRPKRKVQLDPHALLLDSSLEGELSIVKQILSKVPDPSLANAEGITALHNAVCGNHKDVVKFLVEIGCDINSADNNGWTPLHCAAFYNDTELCSYLVEHGASVYATTYSDCQTPSQKCSRLEDNYDQCFQYLHDCKDHVGKLNNGRVYSLFDYASEGEDELALTCGELLNIQRRGDSVEKEWWWAENSKGETGYVPFNLLGLYPRVAAEV